ncbi:TPA: hypothetical protein EYP83_02770 [Candidatus Geothermarchaeota archaeon]|nr:hypothetical protein [Candidatus Geothermarchaeota archaeon]
MNRDWNVETKILEVLRDALKSLMLTQETIDPVRERMIHVSREISVMIRNGFKMIYKGEYNKLDSQIKIINSKIVDVMATLREDEYDILSRILYDPLKEYVELILLYSIVSRDSSLLSYIGEIDPRIVLDGYVDLMGELLRLVQKAISDSNCMEALKIIQLCEEIYMEFYISQIGNYLYRDHKGKSDRMRSILERVKSDYIYGCVGR